MEPWEVKVDIKRQKNTVEIFLIFCEDEVSERLYLESFENDKLKINIIPNQKSDFENVLRAYNHCKIAKSFKNAWCVYDRDANENEHFLSEDKFNLSIGFAETKDINVAWSNDVFELWILLHFKDITAEIEKYNSRDAVYTELTNIFKNITGKYELLDKLIENNHLDYKKNLKRRKYFPKIVLPELLEGNRVTDAIARAKVLHNMHISRNTEDYNDYNPCTLMYNLVEELLSFH